MVQAHIQFTEDKLSTAVPETGAFNLDHLKSYKTQDAVLYHTPGRLLNEAFFPKARVDDLEKGLGQLGHCRFRRKEKKSSAGDKVS